jgi:hypothetical protein
VTSDKIQQYRQPLVTATGIFLGFMLEFANSWYPKAFTTYRFRDTAIAVGMLVSIALLVVVLYRILQMNYPADKIERYYSRTLQFFIGGVSIPFFSMAIIMIEKMLANLLLRSL